jgi:type IV pilus biogenesis protein PilP
MQNKIKLFFCAILFGIVSVAYANAATEFDDVVDVIESVDDEASVNDEIAAEAIENYQVGDSLFQQITDLEQEKVLMQLEKERAQLNLDLDRLAAEKIKLHMEIDTLSGRAEQQQQEFETERARLEAEAKRLEKEKAALDAEPKAETSKSASSTRSFITEEKQETEFGKKYKLINVFGAGAQLQATIQDLSNGQNRRVGVGKQLDGYTVKSISLDEGVVFTNGEETQTLNVGGSKVPLTK